MPLKLSPLQIEKYPKFQSSFPWLGSDLQTLRDFLMPRPKILQSKSSKMINFMMTDGTDDKLSAKLNICHTENTHTPLVILIHGLTGCANSSYMLRSTDYFLKSGYSVLRLNLRGANPKQDRCKEHYHAGRGGDLEVVLNQLVKRGLGSNGFLIIGFSLGGSILLKFLEEFGQSHEIHAAVSISAPIDLVLTSERLMQPRNKLYHRWLLNSMKSSALALKDLNERQKKAIRTAKTVFEFDDRFIAPHNNYLGALDYYKKCSSKDTIDNIMIPTLMISGLNDPWVPSKMYLSKDWTASSYVRAILPDNGGHVGFHDRRGCWYNRVSKIFFSELGF